MKAPVTYIPLMSNFEDKREANDYGKYLDNQVEWVRRDRTPRQEAFYSKIDAPYTYGSGDFSRTYSPNLVIPDLLFNLWFVLERDHGVKYEACFLNKYEHAREHLGWHADDSDVIDDSRPIAVISFGAERELWFRSNPGHCYACNGSGRYDHNGSPKCAACDGSGRRTTEVEKQLLETGSLCIMAAGMQDTHQHRIPKHHAKCGTRISLTFRGLI
jgi:alkylated DNA repair dioxygenase AlkB